MLRLTAAVLIALVACPARAELPAFIIELPPSVSDVWIADAGASRFHRFANRDGAPAAAGSTYMSIGRNGVGKARAWDRRTPLGIYFIVDELDTSRLHEKYGVAAFPLDYPNVRDRQLGRSGDGIWVHGVLPGEQRPARDTDGCLALPNADIAALAEDFLPLSTPVIVARDMRWQDEATRAALRRELRAAVLAWADSRAAGDLHGWLAHYADDFSYRGLSREQWSSLKAAHFAAAAEERLQVEELLLLADPEEPGLYLSRFRLKVVDASGQRALIKRLYWRRDDEGRLAVVAEDNG